LTTFSSLAPWTLGPPKVLLARRSLGVAGTKAGPLGRKKN